MAMTVPAPPLEGRLYAAPSGRGVKPSGAAVLVRSVRIVAWQRMPPARTGPHSATWGWSWIVSKVPLLLLETAWSPGVAMQLAESRMGTASHSALNVLRFDTRLFAIAFLRGSRPERQT